jgi:hypothetical protein
MGCFECYRTKVECLKFLKLSIEMMSSSGRVNHQKANLLSILGLVLGSCAKKEIYSEECVAAIDSVYERAVQFLGDQIISVESWYKDCDERTSN